MKKNPIFLHIGNNVSVIKRDVLCILEPDSSTVSRVTRDYVKQMQQSGQVKVISPELPGAFVTVAPVGGKSMLYISHISAATLGERS